MIYKIKSVNFSDTDSEYIYADYSNVVMAYLIAYIQFAFYKTAPEYGLSPQQVGNILNSVYGLSKTEPTDNCFVVDMFDVWEKFCMAADAVLNICMFKKEKLCDELVKQFNYIITK